MASIVSRPNGRFEIQFKRPDGKRATIRLGKCRKPDAAKFADRIDRLIGCLMLDQPVGRELAEWIKGLPDVMHVKLAKAGLIGERPNLTLGGLTDYFKQQLQGKPSTIAKYGNVIANLRAFYGPLRPLSSVSPGDADEFRTFLLTEANRQRPKTGLAPKTAQKRLRNAKKIFETAVRKGWIGTNPFADLTIRHAMDKSDRFYFVDSETTHTILDACDNEQFQLLFALVRFGGLRHPSETQLMAWSWVDWDADNIRFRSPKTEHLPNRAWRTIPIFAELRGYLEAAWSALGDGAPDQMFPGLQASGAAITKRLTRVCRKVGIEPWPKPWVNLRSTRQTEIEELFGLKCACDWIGNSEAVARRHYLQVTREHHARAVADGAGAKRPAAGATKATQKAT